MGLVAKKIWKSSTGIITVKPQLKSGQNDTWQLNSRAFQLNLHNVETYNFAAHVYYPLRDHFLRYEPIKYAYCISDESFALRVYFYNSNSDLNNRMIYIKKTYKIEYKVDSISLF